MVAQASSIARGGSTRSNSEPNSWRATGNLIGSSDRGVASGTENIIQAAVFLDENLALGGNGCGVHHSRSCSQWNEEEAGSRTPALTLEVCAVARRTVGRCYHSAVEAESVVGIGALA